MLVGAGAVAVPAVIGEIDQPVRFVFCIYYLGGKNNLVADKGTEFGIVVNTDVFEAASGFEIGNGIGYRPYPQRQPAAKGDIFAERYQMAFVVTSSDDAVFIHDKQ